MIRLFTIFCKLNQLSFSDKQWHEREVYRLIYTNGTCPICHAKLFLSPFASYTRYLIEWQDGHSVTQEVTVPRCQCSSCGHTHALLSSALVPYSSYSLRLILLVLRAYFLKTATISQICERAGIAVSTLYRWKALFLTHKSLWLGILEDMTTSADLFLDTMDGIFLREFFHKFSFSFLQPFSGSSRNLTRRKRLRTGTST